MSIWCPFLDPDLTMHHLNIGIHLRQVTKLGPQEESHTLAYAQSGREPYSWPDKETTQPTLYLTLTKLSGIDIFNWLHHSTSGIYDNHITTCSDTLMSYEFMIQGNNDVVVFCLWQANAQKLAEFLVLNPLVTRVNYAGLPNHSGRDLHFSQVCLVICLQFHANADTCFINCKV